MTQFPKKMHTFHIFSTDTIASTKRLIITPFKENSGKYFSWMMIHWIITRNKLVHGPWMDQFFCGPSWTILVQLTMVHCELCTGLQNIYLTGHVVPFAVTFLQRFVCYTLVDAVAGGVIIEILQRIFTRFVALSDTLKGVKFREIISKKF